MPFSKYGSHFNQPTFWKKNYFLGSSKILRFMDMPLAISPLSKFSASLPPKNCNFLAQYISPRFLIFQVVLLLNQLWLYIFIPHSFLETMQGWWRFFLSLEYLNSNIWGRSYHVPCFLISTFITVRRKYHKLFHSPSFYPIERI